MCLILDKDEYNSEAKINKKEKCNGGNKKSALSTAQKLCWVLP